MDSENPENANPAAFALAGVGRELRVLIACRSPSRANRLTEILRAAGLSVTDRRVDTPVDFARELKEFSPGLVLSDYSLSSLTGPQALRLVKEGKADLPVIVIAEAGNRELAMECLALGADDFLPEPQIDCLSSAVLNTLRHKESDRRRLAAEEALRRSEEQYRLIAENIDDLICLLDIGARVLYASPSCQRLLGYTSVEVMARERFDLVHPDDRRAFDQLLEEARFLHGACKADLRLTHRDGRCLFFESSVAFIYGKEESQPPYAVMVSRDITERKRAEEEIQRLAAFPRSNPNPVLEFAADGTLTYFNQAAEAMAKAFQKQHPRDILPLNYGAVVRMCLAINQHNLRLENTLANRTLQWSFYPIQERQVAHCYAEDITGRLELETRLRQSQKMESVGQLAAGVAHDFNNILTIIQGHSGLLLASQAANTPLGESIRQIAHAAERAANLTRQLLMFSRKQLAQPQLMDLNEAVKESSKMLRVLVGDSIQLQIDYGVNLPAIYADPSMIQQVLINLAVNARDAMPKGGRLTISSREADVEETHAERIPDARPGRFVCLVVTDTGCGMDAGTLERIFEPFFTTKGPGQGTGLGLATVYAIVKQHQGWVEVMSVPNQGTTFRIFFPVASKAAERDRNMGPMPVAGGRETVLVVEDERALRELVLEILQQYGYGTIEASNGVEALRLWDVHRDRIDLVLTDVMMPEGVSGRDLAEKILADNPKMKVIYTSGYPMDVLGRDFQEKEGLIFLQKPYHPQNLAKIVRDSLDGLPVQTA